MLSKQSQVELKESPKIAQSTRTGIRIIGTEETNLPGVDYNNIGSDSTHRKDVTTIVNAEFVDVETVEGHISSSYGITGEPIPDYGQEESICTGKEIFTYENNAQDLLSIHVFGMSKQHEYDNNKIITATNYTLNEDSPEITYTGGTTLTLQMTIGEGILIQLPVFPIVGQVNMMNLEVSKGDVTASKFIPYYNFVMPVLAPLNTSGYNQAFINDRITVSKDPLFTQNGVSAIRLKSEYTGTSAKCLCSRDMYSNSWITDGYSTGGLLYRDVKLFTCQERTTVSLTFNVSTLSSFTNNNVLNGLHSVCNGQETICLTLSAVHTVGINGSLTEIEPTHTENFYVEYNHRMKDPAIDDNTTVFTYRKIASVGSVHLVLIAKSGVDTSLMDYCFGVMINGKICHPYNYSSITSTTTDKIRIISVKAIRRTSTRGAYEFIVRCNVGTSYMNICVTANTLGNINAIMYADLENFADHYVCENVIVNNESLSSTVNVSPNVQHVQEGKVPCVEFMGIVGQPDSQSTYRPSSGISIKRHYKFNSWKNGIMKRVRMYAGCECYPNIQVAKTISMSCGRQAPIFVPEMVSVAHGETTGIATEYLAAIIVPIILPMSVAIRNTDTSITLLLRNQNGTPSQDQSMALDTIDNCNIMGGSYFILTLQHYSIFYTNLRKAVLGDVCENIVSIDSVPATYCGSLILFQTHSTNSAGSPLTVQFAESVNDAEFILGTARYATESMEYRGRALLSTVSGVYTPSILYKMSGTASASIKDIPRNMKAYHAVSMYLFASGNGYTSVYASDEISTVCIGTVIGDCISRPMSTSSDVTFVTVSGINAFVYSLFNGKIKRIKTIPMKRGINPDPRLLIVSDLGVCLVVCEDVNDEGIKAISAYSLSGGNVIGRGTHDGVTDIVYIESDETTSIQFIKEEKWVCKLVRSETKQGSFISSKYLFPKFDGMTMLLAGLVITTQGQTTYKIAIISPIGTLINSTISVSKSQTVIRLPQSVPLAYASYQISDLSGTIIDIKWIVYPVPLVSETI